MIVTVLAVVLSQQAAPALPDGVRADPFGYERAECSPWTRNPDETLEACQVRVRQTLTAALGDAVPDALKSGADLGPRPIRTIPSARVVPDEQHCRIIGSTGPDGRTSHHEQCTDRPASIPVLGNH
jgi:hypothetical protein